MLQFDEEMIKACGGTCPPAEAVPVNCTLYRAVETNPAEDKDFLSWVKLERKSARRTRCDHWGLSVWTEMSAVEHARDIIPRMQELYIAEGAVSAGDGVLMATPTGNQPEHHSFWNCLGVELRPKFTVVLDPVPEGA